MNFNKRLTACIFIALCVLLLSACAEQPQDAIRFGLSSMPVTLDPRFATDAASSRINRLLYQRLVDFDARSIPVPAMASWEKISPAHYRFTLGKNGRRFSNGLHLISEDIKATYDFILNEDNASPHRVSLAHINRINIIDQDTVDFILGKPDALFPGRLGIGILPAALIKQDHAFNRNPVGSGALSIEGWPDESHLRLQRTLDKQIIEFIHVPDPTVRVLKLLRGEIDILQNDLPPELVVHLQQQDGMTVNKGAGSNFAYLGFNMDDDVVGQRQVREAIAHALDRDAMIRYVLGNGARPASALLPPDHWAGHAGLGTYEYNPDLSRQLLAEAGYGSGKRLVVVYKTSNDPFRIRLATIIQQQLAEVGIDVDLRSYDWGTFYGDIKSGNFQMYSLMWVGIKMPDIFRYVFHSSAIPPQGANRGRFISAKADGLIEAAENGETLSEQARYYQELQAYLLESLPYVPLWYEDHVLVTREDISGFTIARDGNYDGLKYVQRK